MKLRGMLIVMCLIIAMIPIVIIGGIQGFESAAMVLIGVILTVTFLVSFILSYFFNEIFFLKNIHFRSS